MTMQKKSFVSLWPSCLIWLIFVHRVAANPPRWGASLQLDTNSTIHTEYVDKNNLTVLNMFNLTPEQLNRIYAANFGNSKDPSGSKRESESLNNAKENRINDIKSRLDSFWKANNSEENPDRPEHEMAAYPSCSTESPENSWQLGNNVTIRFPESLFEPKRRNLNLDSAILRLYRKPNSSAENSGESAFSEEVTPTEGQKLKRCVEPTIDPQIRITVSIVQQMRRNKRGATERTKRICNTIMMNVSKTGWIEIDIKRAIYIWEDVERQQNGGTRHPHVLVGLLLIEVHDEEERPLKPGLFFEPPKCDQADFAIPWNYYRPYASMSSLTQNEMPKYPRLDVKLTGYASFVPKDYNAPRLRDNLFRQFHNLSKNSGESIYATNISNAANDENLLETMSIDHDHKQTKHRQRRRRHHHRQHRQHHYQHQELLPVIHSNQEYSGIVTKQANSFISHYRVKNAQQHQLHHILGQQQQQQQQLHHRHFDHQKNLANTQFAELDR